MLRHAYIQNKFVAAGSDPDYDEISLVSPLEGPIDPFRVSIFGSTVFKDGEVDWGHIVVDSRSGIFSSAHALNGRLVAVQGQIDFCTGVTSLHFSEPPCKAGVNMFADFYVMEEIKEKESGKETD